MDVSLAALCVCLFAYGATPSSADLMFDGFNEPNGHYRSTRHPQPSPWFEGPASPSMPGPYQTPYMPGHGPYGPHHRVHHGPHGPHGPHPGHNARTPGGNIGFPGTAATWATTTRNPPPGMPGHKHSPGWNPSWGTVRPTVQPPVQSVGQPEIPLSLLNRLNAVDDIEEFFRLVEGGDTRPQELDQDIVNRFGEADETVLRKPASPYAKPAHCIPENQTVELRVPDLNPSSIFYPTCTRVPRCGGCCAGAIQRCQPTEMSTINVKVIVTNYENGQLRNPRDTLISVEQHTKCACQCIVKEKDCGPMQRYIPGECRCECTNRDDRAKCQVGTSRLWDNSTCACICRQERSCSTGRLFSPRSCECEKLPERKRRTYQQASSTQSEEELTIGT